jgi:hypothetical protein
MEDHAAVVLVEADRNAVDRFDPLDPADFRVEGGEPSSSVDVDRVQDTVEEQVTALVVTPAVPWFGALDQLAVSTEPSADGEASFGVSRRDPAVSVGPHGE